MNSRPAGSAIRWTADWTAAEAGPAVVAAYLRADLFEKRNRLMEDWARYCNTACVADTRVMSIRHVAA